MSNTPGIRSAELVQIPPRIIDFERSIGVRLSASFFAHVGQQSVLSFVVGFNQSRASWTDPATLREVEYANPAQDPRH